MKRCFHALLIAGCCVTLAAAAAGKRAVRTSSAESRPQAIIFIDSNTPADNRISREINHQLYLSPTLARQLDVILIDINPSGFSLSGAARFLKDPSGVWVEKYRPAGIPELFCLQGTRRQSYKLTTAEDIRKCL
ncbi:hypothetical protein [Tatumella citrea]|uniref:Uncharacterized protein n=1 Tax=Tatumella citrea TaxID=53336 RepID=A0A1Y0L549_TATCI|nr:hypothetical protein [Tatumella citrea]ARU93164.1 hypothetical protein A7K98_04750 [Tatumella citrea]ARU97203.1 hypothetical protein A7K99_04750 [Tatumella citrea]